MTPARASIIVLIAAVIAWVSLTPQPQAGPHVGLVLFTGQRATADALLNVAFYVPLGVALGLLPLPWSVAALLGGLVSVTMEGAQLLVPGRVSSLSDLATNTAGAALGVLALRTRGWWLDPRGLTVHWLPLVAGGAFAATCCATGYLMAPDFGAGTYVSQWVPDLGQYDQPYDGIVREVRVGGHPVPPGTVEGAADVRRALLEGEAIVIRATAGSAPRSLSPIFRLVRRPRDPLVVVGADKEALIVSFRRRATRWGLDRPTHYAWGLLTHVSQATELRIGVWRNEGRTCASVNEHMSCALSPTVGDGWSLLLNPHRRSRTGDLLLTLVWLSALSFPCGLWLRRGPRSIAGPALMLASAAATPALTVLDPTRPWEWAAIATGFGVGLGVQRLRRQMIRSGYAA